MLLAIFVAFPLVVFGQFFFAAIIDPFSGAGPFFLVAALFSSILALLSFNQMFGYMALASVIISDLAYGLPLFLFAPHVAISLAFAEGNSSLRPYYAVAKMMIFGERENVSSNLELCFHRMRRRLIAIFVTLSVLSIGYGLLPTILPTSSNVVGLAIYATVALFVFALIALYLGTVD